MSFMFALLLSGALPAADPAFENLNFSSGTLKGWEGEGFYITGSSRKGPGLGAAVCSSDTGKQGRAALLHRTIVVPANAGVIRFRAYARLGPDCTDDEKLDVLLMASGRQVLPKMVRGADDWQPVARLLPPQRGKPREYLWHVSNYIGQSLRIVLLDDDKRPGCHVYCSGFSIIPSDEFDTREFGQFMTRLAKEHKLAPPARYDSKHFMSLSNADSVFTETELQNCELLHEMFFDHFRRKGFRLHASPGKLMVAIFNSQAGFEACLGHKMPPSITGVYDKRSNRFLVYDYATNESYVDFRRSVKEESRRINSDLDRQRFVETENRRAREFRTGVNVGTIMHEVAHQLSFNTGMLNRDGDVPIWLAEGLACYCEATDNLAWRGIGEPNQERVAALVGPSRGQGRLTPLREMISGDAWLRQPANTGSLGLAYAQSWALFRMLMEDRPEQVPRYLSLIYSRYVPEHRVADFGQAFTHDLERLDLRYGQYIKEIVEKEYRPRK